MRQPDRWLGVLNDVESIDVYRELALAHALRGGALGKKIAKLIYRDDLAGLCQFEISYDEDKVLIGTDATLYLDNDAERRRLYVKVIRECRQALAYFQKLDFLDIGIDKKEVALAKFLEAEEKCRVTNEILRLEASGAFHMPLDVAGVLYTAQRKIARVLGPVPSLSELRYKFGPGATRLTKRREANARSKVREGFSCSEELFQSVRFLAEELPHLTEAASIQSRTDEDGTEWERINVTVLPAALRFVPKNAKTDRTVGVEPGLNTLVQLAYGAHIGKRLAAFGIDIRDQTVNQCRAREGSLTGALATLDLVSASDTIATELVMRLLPLDWAAALGRARTAKIELPDGRTIRQEKFSSMGNGFTFPLQTLIFWSLAASCCDKESDATVYGDDIVVPVSCVDLVKKVLHCAGFTVNAQKSYSTGPFRESCGKDYVWGIDIRPVYPRGLASPQSLFVLHNFYKRSGDEESAERVLMYINPALKLYGPDGYGDGHLVGEYIRHRPSSLVKNQYGGSFFRSYVTRTGRDTCSSSPEDELAAALYTVYAKATAEAFWNPPKERPDGRQAPTVKSGLGYNRDVYLLWAKYSQRAIGARYLAALPIPEHNSGEKAYALPEVVGYEKIKIYHFG